MTRIYHTALFRPIKRMANHPKTLLLGVLASWLVAALLFGIIEHQSIIDSLYWSMTTMSTVGYGDISAASVLGKIVTIAFQAWSIFVLVPSAVANIIDSVRVDEHKMTHAEQEWLFNAMEVLADCNGKTLPPQPHDYE
jgi:voltage-gated potassium channel